MLNNTGRIGIVFQHWSARVSKHQYRRDWALTVCGNTIFASSKHPVARYGPMTRVARVRRNTRCGVPLHSFGGHRCDRNTNPECFDARKLVAAGCPPKKCCRNTHFLQCEVLGGRATCMQITLLLHLNNYSTIQQLNKTTWKCEKKLLQRFVLIRWTHANSEIYL